MANDPNNPIGTVNGKRLDRSEIQRRRQQSMRGRKRRRKKTGNSGKTLPVPIQQQIQDGIEDVAAGMVDKIADLTVNPFKKLMTPNGIGAAVAVATKSPVAGMLTAGALSTTGTVVKGLGKFVQALQEQLQLEHAKRDMKDGVSGNNNDILDALNALIHDNKLILSEAKLARIEQERQLFKQIEADRELSAAEKERTLLLEQLVDTMDKLKPKKEDKKGLLGKGFDWVVKGILGMMGFKYLSGKMVPNTGLGKLLTGAQGKGGLFGLVGKLFDGLIKFFPKAIVGALKRFSPIGLVIGLYEGIKGAFQGWIEHGNFEGILSGILGQLTEFLSFGLIKHDAADSFFYKIFDGITDAIGWVMGNAYLALEKAGKSILTADYSEIFMGIVKNIGGWIADTFWKEMDDWAGILKETGISDKFNSIIDVVGGALQAIGEKFVAMWNKLLTVVEKAANIIPGVDVALTPEAKKAQAERRRADLQRDLSQVDRQIAFEQGKSTGTGLFGYKPELKQAELNRLQNIRSGITSQLKTIDSTLLPPITSPAQAKSMDALQQNMINNQMKLQREMMAGTSPFINAPTQNSTVHTVSNTSNFVGPVSRRNNENTFVRTQDKNSPGRGM